MRSAFPRSTTLKRQQNGSWCLRRAHVARRRICNKFASVHQLSGCKLLPDGFLPSSGRSGSLRGATEAR